MQGKKQFTCQFHVEVLHTTVCLMPPFSWQYLKTLMYNINSLFSIHYTIKIIDITRENENSANISCVIKFTIEAYSLKEALDKAYTEVINTIQQQYKDYTLKYVMICPAKKEVENVIQA